MKFQVTMKSPDCLIDAVNDAVGESMGRFPDCTGDGEFACAFDDAVSSVKESVSKWFKYGEMVTLEIDTEQETCVVKET